MKKQLITILILISFTGIASADQLAYITKEQAEKGAAFIRIQKEVLLFCGCCENDPKVYLSVKDVSVQHTGYQNFYQVIISGVNRGGEKMTVEADLAYVHVNINGMAVAAGKFLNFECDPCVQDLKWDSDLK